MVKEHSSSYSLPMGPILRGLSKTTGYTETQLLQSFQVISTAQLLAFVAIISVFMLYRGGRKRLKRMWKLSKEGPIFKLGVWCWTKILSGVLVLDRAILGSRLVGDASGCPPKFTVIKTQSDRIILAWTAQRTSKWADDDYELQVQRQDTPAGNSPCQVKTWETLYRGCAQAFDFPGLNAGQLYSFRLRTVNGKGASAWVMGSFETRQVPEDNGGTGPNYKWQQNSTHIKLSIECRESMQSKDLFVECKASSIKVSDKGASEDGKETLLQGDFTAGIKADEAAWALVGDKQTGGQRVVFLAEKQKPTTAKAEHWRSVLKGHALLDPRTLAKHSILNKLDM